MQDKGYAHPLYSLDLVPPGSGAAAPPAAIEAEEGLLVVRPALLRRAAQVRSAECYGAVCAALGHWERTAVLLSPYGLDAAWAESLRHWGERLLAWDGECQGLAVALAGRTRPRRELAAQGRRLWRQLTLSLQLAGLDARLRPGPMPRGGPALLGRLGDLCAQIDEPGPAAQLATFGFGPALRDELRRVVAAAAAERQRTLEAQAGRQRTAGAVLVARGALLGDLARLQGVARQQLLPPVSRALGVRRLLGA